MKWLDIPPVWTLGAMALAIWSARILSVRSPVLDLAGAALIALGLGLMLWSVAVMAARRTNPLPHTQPSALVTTGPFARTRNPIYLGDLMVLAGAALWSGGMLGLILVPVLMAILVRRFISPEEDRLRAAFGTDFEAYAGRVRRWV